MEILMKQRHGTEFLHEKKKNTHRYSSIFAEHLGKPESGCEHSEVVGGAFQQ